MRPVPILSLSGFLLMLFALEACLPIPDDTTPSPEDTDCRTLAPGSLHSARFAGSPTLNCLPMPTPTPVSSSDLDQDGVGAEQDCNDGDGSVYPGAPEVCDGYDNDCDPSSPADDADEDGVLCSNGDCDDNNASVYPGAVERCGDGLSNGCSTKEQSCLTNQLSIAQAQTILIGPAPEDAAGHTLLSARLTGCGPESPQVLVIPAERSDAGEVFVLPLPLPPGEHPLVELSRTRLLGGRAGSWTGNQLAAGDLNGDGCEDLVISAPYDSNINAGRIYIVYGPLPPGELSLANCAQCVTLAARTPNGYFGNSMAIADLNGDHQADLVVSAWHDRAGVLYLYSGTVARQMSSEAAETLADASWKGEEVEDWFGFRTIAPGDLNRDGYPDVLVSAPGHAAQTGALYAIFGNPHGYEGEYSATDTGAKMLGESPGDLFGDGLAGVGDATGDGHPEVIVGASYHSDTAPLTGRAYLFAGGWGSDGSVLEAETSAQWQWNGTEGGQELGYNLGSVGDLNGDGLAEVAIGLPYLNTLQGAEVLGLAGQTELVFGARWTAEMDGPLPELSSIRLMGDRYEGWSGYSILGVSDVNGDGLRDFLIGAPSASMAASEPGRIYVLAGEAP